MEIRALRPSDDRSGFRCGDSALDSFLQKYAAQNQFRHHVGTTYVAVEEDRLVGYVTVSPGHIESDDLLPAARKALPRYPLPILRVARLAVDGVAQGAGVGRALLRFSMMLARHLADRYGCIGLVVDAVPAAIDFYRRLGFIELDVIEGESAMRPAPVTMFLSTKQI